MRLVQWTFQIGGEGRGLSERVRWETFLDEYLSWAAPMEAARNRAWWDAALGDPSASARLASLDRQWVERHSSTETFGSLSRWRSSQAPATRPTLLRRQLELVHLAYAAEQRDPETLDAELTLEQRLRDTFNGFRATLDGALVDDNAIDRLLRQEKVGGRLRQVWEASKQVGAEVAPTLRELARLRTRSARRAGYPTYWHRALAQREIDPTRLEALLEQVDQATRVPFQKAKQRLDQRLSTHYQVSADELRPWHYQDPYFQRAPSIDGDPLDVVAAELELIPIGVRSFDGIGIDLRPTVERSDFWPRPGKSQHAFCTHIDRRGDVRVLLNMTQSGRWLRTLLHELGHAAYESLVDPALPFLLRDGAHALIHEGLAMMLEEMAGDPQWLEVVAGLPAAHAASLSQRLADQKRVDRLVFMRWCLCIVRFERTLYRDPDGDLDTEWWREVERSQFLTAPDARSAPDWAAKIHLSESPVYYQSYLLGTLLAAQLGSAIRESTGGAIAEHRGVGRHLVQRLFRFGARWPWESAIQRATGAPLGVEAFAALTA